MKPAALYREFEAGFAARKFSAGLLIAFIDFLTELDVTARKPKNFSDFLAIYPKQEVTAAGKHANTLIVDRGGGAGTLSLRPFYNKAEQLFRAENKRFDYPSCAPHATQAWADYVRWLDALVTFTPAQLQQLRSNVVDFVLRTLKSHEFDPRSVRSDPPLFRLILESFNVVSQPGEPTGAAYQGIVFGFLRADNPHLQVEIGKVRTGSKRLQRVGDIDCWEGARLAISAEVKQYVVKTESIPDLEGFANETGRRGALGLVVSLAFDGEARQQVEAAGLKAIDRADMLRIVELWDPLKQRTAVQSLVYYVTHIEKNSSLTERVTAFIEPAEEESKGIAGPDDAVSISR